MEGGGHEGVYIYCIKERLFFDSIDILDAIQIVPSMTPCSKEFQLDDLLLVIRF
jgi:hypothetical protein